MSLLAKSKKEGQIQHITPQSAGWRYIGFDVWMLKKGQTVTLESGDRELCLVLVAGLASVKTTQADFPNLGKRMSPFERTPPWSVYVPPQDKVEVTADSDLELAVCSAPGKGTLPARVIRPQDVGVEHRGKGRNQRLVHNILPDNAQADCLLVVEVYTDEGATSSWPSHHDTALPGKKPSWKRPTITVSIRRRVLPSSASTPMTAAWMPAWRLQPRCGHGAARLPSGGGDCRI
jgi:5-deoxy-glucuronate isomerase